MDTDEDSSEEGEAPISSLVAALFVVEFVST